MIDLVLVEPEIPPNTGNIIRLCANTGVRLHLVRPLGFTLDKRSLRRAGLDYRWMASVEVHEDFAACRTALSDRRCIAVETGSARRYDQIDYRVGDAVFLGSERSGFSAAQLASFDPALHVSLPMLAGNRSLNLSNAAAVVVYEAWRQLGFAGAASRFPP